MGHNNKSGTSAVPSCCNWVWSCCCFHCSGSVYIDNVVVQPTQCQTVTTFFEKVESGDGANPNLYGTNIEKENLIVNDKRDSIELNSYPQLPPNCECIDPPPVNGPVYRDHFESDLDSYGERMSLAGSDVFFNDEYINNHVDYHKMRNKSLHSFRSEGSYVDHQGYMMEAGSSLGSYGSPTPSGQYSQYSTLQCNPYTMHPDRESSMRRVGLNKDEMMMDNPCMDLQDNPHLDQVNPHLNQGLPPHMNPGNPHMNPGGNPHIMGPSNPHQLHHSNPHLGPQNPHLGPQNPHLEQQNPHMGMRPKPILLVQDADADAEERMLQGMNPRNDEEESAYEQHFRNEVFKEKSAGEYRIPSLKNNHQQQRQESPHYTKGKINQGGTWTTETQQQVDGSVPRDPNVDDQAMRTISLERMDRLNFEMHPPTDRWHLLYLTLVLQGVGTIIPWNIFINAKSQQRHTRTDWIFLLQDYLLNYELGAEISVRPEMLYTSYFLQYLTLAHLPNLVFNWLNVFFQFGGCITPRIVWSLLAEILVMICTIVLAMMDTSHSPDLAFYISLVSVLVLNMAAGVYQNTVYSLAAKLPAKYTGAVVLGQNLSGSLVSFINIISIWISPSARTAAIYYFISGLFLLLACFDTYFALPLNRFYRYNEFLTEKCKQEEEKSVLYLSYWMVFKKCLPQLVNIFLTFCITLSIFPGVLADVDRVYTSFFIAKEYFIAVVCFFTFNVFSVIGNILATALPPVSNRVVLIGVLCRFLFLPFFLLCNYRPGGIERLWPVLFHWDWFYWFGNMFFSVSGGYLATTTLTLNNRCVEPHLADVAGMFGCAAMGTGILVGIGISALMPGLISLQALDWELPWFWPAYNPSG